MHRRKDPLQWRRVREFKYLFYASGLGFGVFVALHGPFEVGAGPTASGGPLHAILQVLDVVAVLAATFVCPPALVIGFGGTLIILRCTSTVPAVP